MRGHITSSVVQERFIYRNYYESRVSLRRLHDPRREGGKVSENFDVYYEVHDLKKRLDRIRKELSNTLDLITWNHTTKDCPIGIPTQRVLDSLKKMVELAK